MTQTSSYLPTEEELSVLFMQKYGAPETTGWAPRRRYKHRYYLPSDVYEATVAKCVTDGSRWIDVGGGRNIFPDNANLARMLVGRCERMLAVDPDPQVNTFANEHAQCLVENYVADSTFDVATMRMVAEHVVYPQSVASALARLVRPGGLLVILTVNIWSPITIVSRFTPFSLHYPLKRLLWGGEEADTFPVAYKLNSRSVLNRIFGQAGFREAAFARIDDLSTFGRFRTLGSLEIAARHCCRALGFAYPEHCLLAVFERLTAAQLADATEPHRIRST